MKTDDCSNSSPLTASEAQVLVDLIANRVSSPRLTEPAPNAEQLEQIFKCALRAPDHMLLRPWRYLVIEGDARAKLGEAFVEAAQQNATALTDAQIEKYRKMPLRAPMMIVAVSTNLPHEKVPVVEQQVSCGVGVGYMLLALQAMGYNGIWRTGVLAEDALVKERLGIQPHESLIGFLYVGTPVGELKAVPTLHQEYFVQNWLG